MLFYGDYIILESGLGSCKNKGTSIRNLAQNLRLRYFFSICYHTWLALPTLQPSKYADNTEHKILLTARTSGHYYKQKCCFSPKTPKHDLSHVHSDHPHDHSVISLCTCGHAHN